MLVIDACLLTLVPDDPEECGRRPGGFGVIDDRRTDVP